VPLRPVSELGLVEITDVPARGNRTAIRGQSTRARSRPSKPLRGDSANDRQVEARDDRPQSARASTQRKPDAGRRTSKSLAAGSQPSAPGKSRRSGASKRLEPSQSRAPSTPKLARTAAATAENSGGKSKLARSSTATDLGSTSERRSARRPRNVPSTRTDQMNVVDAPGRGSSTPRRMSATTTDSARSRNRSKAVSDTGSGGATRSATTRTPKRPSGSSAGTTRGATTARRQNSAGSRTTRNAASRDRHRSRNGPRPNQPKPSSGAKIGIYALAGASLVAGGLLLARAALHR